MCYLVLLGLAGWVAVATVPPGARVTLGEGATGVTPFMARCEAGTTSVRVEMEWVRSFFRAETTLTAVVRDEETTWVSVNWAAPLFLDSHPQSAAVRLNGVGAGTTPIVLRGLTPGTHRITLSHPSCGDTSVHMTLWPSRPTRILLSMQCPEPPPPERRGLPLHVPAGGALVSLTSGLAAWLFHEEADRTYQVYLDTTDPNEMEDSFRKAKRLDRAAAAFWAVSLSSLLATMLWSAMMGGA